MTQPLARALAMSLAAHLAAAGGVVVFGPGPGSFRQGPERVDVQWDETPSPDSRVDLLLPPPSLDVSPSLAPMLMLVTVTPEMERRPEPPAAAELPVLGLRWSEEAALLGEGPGRRRGASRDGGDGVSESSRMTKARVAAENPGPAGPTRGARPVEGRCDPPEYPAMARSRGRSGVVEIELEIDASGRVGSVRVARSSGDRHLDRAAADALARWVFEPALRDGRAVPFTLCVPIRFSLARR